MKSARPMLLGAVIVSVFFVLSPARAVTLPQTGKLFPAETTFLINVSDFSRLEAQFKKTNLYKLYKDPAMAVFVENFQQKWRQTLQEKENEFIKALFDAGVRPTGRLTVALMTRDYAARGEDFGVVVISQWGPGIDKIKQAIDKMVQKILAEGAKRTHQVYRSVDIITIIKPRPPKQVRQLSVSGQGEQKVIIKTVERAPLTVSYCFLGDVLIAGTDVNIEALKFVLAHVQGVRANALADSADYVGTIKSLGTDRDIELYLNTKQLIQTSIDADSSGKTRTMMTNLGFGNVGGFGFSIGFARKAGTFCNGVGFLKVAGPKRGVLKILEPVLARINPPRFISGSACSLSFLHLNIKTAYDELLKLLSSINPMLAAPFMVPLVPPGADGQGGLELKRDVIEYLAPEIIIAQGIKKDPQAAVPVGTIVSVAVTDRKALEKSLFTLHSKLIAPSAPDARRELLKHLLGHTIYTLKLSLPSLPGPGRIPMQQAAPGADFQMPQIAFTVTDTHLIVGSESSVEQAIRRLSELAAPTIEQAAWFRAVKSAIPAVVGFAGLTDSAAYNEFIWRQLKAGAAASSASSTLGPGPFPMVPQGLGRLVDFSLLPEFETVRKYFGLSASYGISRADGFYFEFKHISPVSTSD